jgi:hypothetical protein
MLSLIRLTPAVYNINVRLGVKIFADVFAEFLVTQICLKRQRQHNAAGRS